MSLEKESEKVAVDLYKLSRVSVKVINLLARKCKNPVDGYLVLKLLVFSFEADFGIHLEPEEEDKLRRLAAQELENDEG